MDKEEGTNLEDKIEDIEKFGEDVSDYYSKLRGYVKALVYSEHNSLFVYSRAGLGKSFQCQSTLEKEGLLRGKDYEVQKGYSTSFELYHTLYEARDKILVLDDIEGIIHDSKALSLLKACTWSVEDKRTVSWGSASSKLEAPKTFTFEGDIIICSNRRPKGNNDLEALKSRSIYHELELTYEELISGVFPKVANNLMDDPEELLNFIDENSNPSYELEIRDLVKAIRLYKYANENGEDWRHLVDGILEANEDLNLVWRLMRDTDLKVKEKVEKFREKTGKSRKTYYNYRKELLRVMNDV